MDALAAELGLDRAEIRRRNLLAADELPYVSVTNQRYDSGDYPRRSSSRSRTDRLRRASTTEQRRAPRTTAACSASASPATSSRRGWARASSRDAAWSASRASTARTSRSTRTGSCTRLDDDAVDRPGHRHDVRAARRRRARGRGWRRSRVESQRHRCRQPRRHGHVRQPQRSLRRRRGGGRGRRAAPPAARGRRRTRLEARRPPTSSSSAASSGSSARRARRSPFAELAAAAEPGRYARQRAATIRRRSAYPYATHACVVEVDPRDRAASTILRYVGRRGLRPGRSTR